MCVLHKTCKVSSILNEKFAYPEVSISNFVLTRELTQTAKINEILKMQLSIEIDVG